MIDSPEAAADVDYFDPQRLQDLVADLFAAAGLGTQDAAVAADILVSADLRGVWSHGVARVPMYLARLRSGTASPRPDIRMTRVAPAVVSVDGDDGLGLIVAPRAMQEAIAIAKEAGIGLAGVRRSGHFGAAGYYTRQATDAGCIGMVFTNASPALPPWGAAKPFFGTSPFAFGAPAPAGAIFQIDMAMSRVARGKLKFAAARGASIPEGYALDSEGRPTTDGNAAFAGTMLPFGEHKGAALAWMMDILGGVFTGAGYGGDIANPFGDLDRAQQTGHVFLAFRADLFMPADLFAARMADLDARAKALPRAAGVDEILAPGEPEQRHEHDHRRRGIPLTPDVVEGLRAEATRASMAWPFP
ncbi:MAG: Ldh family oxidoreductase [Hyphomicrobiaceae bacterium]